MEKNHTSTDYPAVSVAIINFNGESVLIDTIRSLYNQNYPAISEILLIDNASTDQSLKVVRDCYPDVHIIPMNVNRGPNPARNVAIRQAKADYVMILDNDIVFEPDVIGLMVSAFCYQPIAGAATAQIRLFDDPEVIQYNGCHIHYVGEAIQNNIDNQITQIGALSAGAVLLDRKKVLDVGGFDEDFFFGWEDGDLAYRLSLCGYPCLAVPMAKVYHKRAATGARHVRFQVRNRWWFILKNYQGRTIWLAMPAILFYQFLVMLFLTLQGEVVNYFYGSLSVLSSLSLVFQKRRSIKRLRKKRDRDLLIGHDFEIITNLSEHKMIRIAISILNTVFFAYWRLIRKLIR